MRTKKRLGVFTALILTLFFLASGANASQRLKGKVEAAYKDESICKVAGDLVKKKDICEKDADVKAGSILVVSGKDSGPALEEGQTVLLKIKGNGKTTGTVITALKDTLKKSDLEKAEGKGTVIVWKNGEKGPIFILKAKEDVTAEKDTEVKMIVKKKAPKVEGC